VAIKLQVMNEVKNERESGEEKENNGKSRQSARSMIFELGFYFRVVYVKGQVV